MNCVSLDVSVSPSQKGGFPSGDTAKKLRLLCLMSFELRDNLVSDANWEVIMERGRVVTSRTGKQFFFS